MTSNRKYSSAIIEEILFELASQGMEVLRYVLKNSWQVSFFFANDRWFV